MPTLRDRIRSLERIPAAQLRANRKNYRTHPEPQRAALRGILGEIGLADALIAYETAEGLTLIDGHLRLEECADETLPVLVLDVTESEADLLLATLDPLAAMAAHDAEKLDALLRDVQTGDQAVADMLTQLAEDAGVLDGDEPPQVVEDDVPEPPVDPITKPGDLWILGEHRLLCGDSTKSEDVERLLNGKRPHLVFTDPPYNCADEMSVGFYQNANSPAMRGLAAAEWDHGFDMKAFLAVLNANIPTDGSVYVCTSHMLAPQIWSWMAGSDATHFSYVVWCKPNPMPSLAKRHWTWATELICYATFGRHVFNFPAEGHALSYWTINKNAANELHPTQKPVGIPEMGIRRSSNPGDLVVDFFCGSGTTIIAAEQLGRRCYGMEISPQYCDVIVARWEKLTGKKAVRA